MRLSDSEVEKIILEETLAVLHEDQEELNEIAVVGRLLGKARGLLKRGGKTKPKPKPGLGANPKPGSTGMGSMGQSKGKAALAWKAATWVGANLLRIPLTKVSFRVFVAYEFIKGIAYFMPPSQAENPFAVQKLSERAQEEYLKLLAELEQNIIVPQEYGIDDLVPGLYSILVKTPVKLIFDLIRMTTPLPELGFDFAGVLGNFFGPEYQREVRERRESELKKIHEVVVENGPKINDEGSFLSEPKGWIQNPDYSAERLNSALRKAVSGVIDREASLAYSQGMVYDGDKRKIEIYPLVDRFVSAISAYGETMPAQPSPAPRDAEVSPGTSTPVTKVPAAKAPKPAAQPEVEPVAKDELRDKVGEILGSAQVRERDQVSAWFSWAEGVRKNDKTSVDAIERLMNMWFDSIRAEALEENRQLFNEVKLFVPTQGKFKFEDFVGWLEKNNTSLGRKPKYRLHDVKYLTYLLTITANIAKSKKAFRRKSDRLRKKTEKISAQISKLEAKFRSAETNEEKKRIEDKIARLTDRALDKALKGSTVNVSQKRFDKVAKGVKR